MERSFSDIEYNYNLIEENINIAAQSIGKKREDIVFLAATKTVEPEFINYAVSLGLRYLGENKVQELLSKYDEYNLEKASLQFIGHLQTNKVRQIIDKVSLIQSVDSIKLAKEISKESIKHNKCTDILVEINIGKEENKSGIMPETTYEFLDEIRTFDNICVKGLMSIPPVCENKQEIVKHFTNMHNIFIDMKDKKLDNICMDILSMGMSSDYNEAIKCGANMVRIGSSLFGARDYSNN